MMNDYLTIVNGVVIDCNTTDVTDVVIPDGVTTIGDRAFSCCESLRSIIIPNGVTSIGRYAFAYCENIMIHCYKNSYAEEYAKKNNIPYKITD